MKLSGRIDRPCPWCKLPVSVGRLEIEPGDELPAEMQGQAVVTHEEPRCIMFEKLGGDAFFRTLELGKQARGAA